MKDFINNMNLLFEDLSFLKLFQMRSDALTCQHTGNNNRLFSVDGGHSKKETYDDLVAAANAINEKGVIVLDDFFNSNWPEVKLGTEEYFNSNNILAPLAYFHNKFLFVKKEVYKYYTQLLSKNEFKEFCCQSGVQLRNKTIFGFGYLHIQ